MCVLSNAQQLWALSQGTCQAAKCHSQVLFHQAHGFGKPLFSFVHKWVIEFVLLQVPAADNYFAALNSAVFTDGSFVYIPKGVNCPMELSTYFRINAEETGQVCTIAFVILHCHKLSCSVGR